MITQKQFKEHYQNLYKNKAIYVWGANCETINKNLTDGLYKAFGSSTYNKTYYDNKLKEGKGKIGADCSGSIYPLSKKDDTAKGYYRACNEKGSINNMPKNVACLVFNASFTHVGAYMGDGTTIEMMSSTKNCVKQNLQKSRWAYYGIPNWLEVKESIAISVEQHSASTNTHTEVIKNIQKWCNNYCNAGLVVDGKFGSKTAEGLCKALQHCLNVEYKANLIVDGKFGSKTKAKCKVASSCEALTYICKAMLLYKGYVANHCIKNNNFTKEYDIDTKNIVLLYQQDTRGLKHDGICGVATFYSMFNS